MLGTMKLLIATNNAHKVREFSRIFPGFSLLLPRDLGLDFDHDETALSFHENALAKAQALYRLLGPETLPGKGGSDWAVIADDSGLCIDALDGAPGIYSARYGMVDGQKLSDQARNTLVLGQMQGKERRDAHFCCAIAAVYGHDDFAIVQAAWHGSIVREDPAGSGGFGYDPILYIPECGCTVAQLSEDEKAGRSHRGQACARLIPLLQGRSA